MRWHPIHDHADAALMEVINEVSEVVGRTIACRRCIVITDLIAPGWTIRMLLQREKLNVGKTHFRNIVRERFGHLAIAEWAVVFFNLSAPRPKVNFVDRQRLPKVLSTTSLFGPTRVSKLELRLINDRRGIGWHFGVLRIRISLHERQPLACADLEFVKRSLTEIWDEEFPNTR